MKILVSWSSGKDSAWMLHVLQRSHPGAAAALLTTITTEYDRVSMHGVRTSVLRAQADAVGLPLIAVPIPSPCPNEIYEARMRDAVERAIAEGFTHVAFGDLFLEDVRRYREERLAGSGLEPLFPLWGQPTDRLAREMVAGGLEAILTCVDPRMLAAAFAGRGYDARLLDELPANVDPCGERGEFHTCVIAGPMFARPIDARVGERVTRNGFVFADLILDDAMPRTPPAPASE
jgi:uncharacterized protein (TIGR00290 family)